MHQTVTEFLNKVWTIPTTNPGMPLQDLKKAIYYLYTPPPQVGISQAWTQIDYHPSVPHQMGWRVYVSATARSLKKVWEALQSLFSGQPDVLAAKHTTTAAAATRVDTIVVYLLNASAKDTLIAGMRTLLIKLWNQNMQAFNKQGIIGNPWSNDYDAPHSTATVSKKLSLCINLSRLNTNLCLWHGQFS